MLKKFLSVTVSFCFFLSTIFPYTQAHADAILNLPSPGLMVNLSAAFEPALIKGLTVHKDNPFLFDFILDTGHSGLEGDALKKEGDRLVKYFFACLTIPEKDLWVNLSPYEKDRMVPQALGQTALGRDLLAQDYILKQLTASLIYPEKDLGKEFWERVYAKARQVYGTSQIPVDTFNKVWIMADKASVYENGQTALVLDGHLKVMLEEDYLALQKHQGKPGDMTSVVSPSTLPNEAGLNVKAPQGNNRTHSIASTIVRQLILPEIEKEVNTGRNFASLRQIYNSLILASWYRKNLKEALINQVYADKSTVKGVNLSDPSVKERIYQQYLKAYKKGVFNYIKQDAQQDGAVVPKKYFSGGFLVGNTMLSVVNSKTPGSRNSLSRAMNSLVRTVILSTLLMINGAKAWAADDSPYEDNRATALARLDNYYSKTNTNITLDLGDGLGMKMTYPELQFATQREWTTIDANGVPTVTVGSSGVFSTWIKNTRVQRSNSWEIPPLDAFHFTAPNGPVNNNPTIHFLSDSFPLNSDGDITSPIDTRPFAIEAIALAKAGVNLNLSKLMSHFVWCTVPGSTNKVRLMRSTLKSTNDIVFSGNAAWGGIVLPLQYLDIIHQGAKISENAEELKPVLETVRSLVKFVAPDGGIYLASGETLEAIKGHHQDVSNAHALTVYSAFKLFLDFTEKYGLTEAYAEDITRVKEVMKGIKKHVLLTYDTKSSTFAAGAYPTTNGDLVINSQDPVTGESHYATDAQMLFYFSPQEIDETLGTGAALKMWEAIKKIAGQYTLTADGKKALSGIGIVAGNNPHAEMTEDAIRVAQGLLQFYGADAEIAQSIQSDVDGLKAGIKQLEVIRPDGSRYLLEAKIVQLTWWGGKVGPTRDDFATAQYLQGYYLFTLSNKAMISKKNILSLGLAAASLLSNSSFVYAQENQSGSNTTNITQSAAEKLTWDKVVSNDFFADNLGPIVIPGVSSEILNQATNLRELLRRKGAGAFGVELTGSFRELISDRDDDFASSAKQFVSVAKKQFKKKEMKAALNAMAGWDKETTLKLLPHILFYYSSEGNPAWSSRDGVRLLRMVELDFIAQSVPNVRDLIQEGRVASYTRGVVLKRWSDDRGDLRLQTIALPPVLTEDGKVLNTNAEGLGIYFGEPTRASYAMKASLPDMPRRSFLVRSFLAGFGALAANNLPFASLLPAADSVGSGRAQEDQLLAWLMYNVYTGTVTENDLRVKFHHIPGFNLDAWVQKGYFKAVPARTGSYEVVSSMIKRINSDGKDSIQEPDEVATALQDILSQSEIEESVAGMPRSYGLPADPVELEKVWKSIGLLKYDTQGRMIQPTVDEVVEAFILRHGISIYDAAVWQIALAWASGGDENILKAAGLPTEAYIDGSFGALHTIRGGPPYFKYGGKELSSDDGFFFRILSPYFQPPEGNPLTLTGETHMPGYPGPGYDSTLIADPDWRPVLGENVWAAIIAPLQVAYVKYKGKIPADSPELKLAASIIQPMLLLTTDLGGILYAPEGTANSSPFNISNENNISAIAALTMLHQVTGDSKYLDMLNKIKAYLKKNGLDKNLGKFIKPTFDAKTETAKQAQNGVLYQGGEARSEFQPNTDKFAVDVQTWAIAFLSPKVIDEELYAPGTAMQMWRATKARAGYYQKGVLFGVGYTNGHGTFSGEWTAGAIAAAMELALYYKESHPEWSKEALDDAIFMVKGLEALSEVKDGRKSYKYANISTATGHGWNARPIPSTASTGWVWYIHHYKNPGVLGGETRWAEFEEFRKAIEDIKAGRVKLTLEEPGAETGDPASDKLEAIGLINQLTDGDPSVVVGSEPYNAILSMGKRAVPALVEVLNDYNGANDNARKWSARLLGAVGDFDVVFPVLTKVIKQFNEGGTRFQAWHKEEAQHGLELLYQRFPDRATTSSKAMSVITQVLKRSSLAGLEIHRQGGINLNTANMAMTITKDASGGVKISFNPALIAKIKAQGVYSAVPVIIGVMYCGLAQIAPLLGINSIQNSSEGLAGLRY